MNKWHYQANGEIKGPFDDEQLKTLCDAGVLNITSKVWQPDFPDWVPISQTDFKYKEELAPPPIEEPTPQHNVRQSFIPEVNTGDNSLPEEDLSMWQYFTRALEHKYADFHGRARRKEYWSYTLFYLLILMGIALVGALIDGAAGNLGPNGVPIVMSILLVIFYFGTVIPTLAVLARRMHDLNITAWIILISLVPYIGSLILLILCLLPTNPQPNKHGPPPV